MLGGYTSVFATGSMVQLTAGKEKSKSKYKIVKVNPYFLVSVFICVTLIRFKTREKVQVGKDQENAQSEKDSHSKNRGGKSQTNNQVLIP